MTPTVDYCPFTGNFTVTYVKGSGPGNFLPGLGASVANLADTASVVVADDDSQSFITDPDIPGDASRKTRARLISKPSSPTPSRALVAMSSRAMVSPTPSTRS